MLLATTISSSKLILGDDQGSDRPECAGQEAVTDAHDDNGYVGVDEAEGQHDMANHSDKD